MQTSGLFKSHSYRIPVSYGKPVRIVFFGDVHRDSPNHAERTWQNDLKDWRKLKDAYFFGMGDYLDSTSTSERHLLNHGKNEFHETIITDLDKLQKKKVNALAEELDFMRGRLIGLLNGNHYAEFSSGINSDQMLADKLGTTYLGVCAFVRVTFESHGQKVSRDIFAHHGTGGSRLPGGSLNRVMQMAEGAEADLYCMGHDHKRGALPATPRLFLENHKGKLKVKHREPIAIRSGSYLASFEDNQTNYNVDACRPPSSLGHVQVLFTCNRVSDGEGGNTVTVNMKTLA